MAKAAEVAPRAGLYARISQDRNGDDLGVKRQLADLEQLAIKRGFAIADTYVDNDVSAYAGKPRPQYERLLADVRDGRIDVVLAWHADRLYRHPRDLEEFVSTVEDAKAAVATVTAGEMDLSTPTGRAVARIVGAISRLESEHKGERQARKARELAQAGKPSGGGSRPFGYEDDRTTVREAEAARIRQAAADLVARRSVRSILGEWEREGVRTPTGKVWQRSPFADMICSARIAGLRSVQWVAGKRDRRGTIVGPASWPGIITPDQREEICAIFDARKGRGGGPRAYLLTGGTLRCGRCGAAMVARPRSKDRRRYACAADFGGCDAMFALAEPLEDYIRNAVFVRLAGPALDAVRAEQAGEDDNGLGSELGALEGRRREVTDAFTAGTVSLEFARRAEQNLARDIDRVRARIAKRQRRGFAGLLPSSEVLPAWWESATVEDRRALVGLVIESVTLRPAVPGRNRFDPERVAIAWRA